MKKTKLSVEKLAAQRKRANQRRNKTLNKMSQLLGFNSVSHLNTELLHQYKSGSLTGIFKKLAKIAKASSNA